MLKVFETEEKDVGKRLDIFLLEKFDEFSRSHIKNLVEKNLVKIDKKLIEFLLYQTGVLIRMAIVISKSWFSILKVYYEIFFVFKQRYC